MNYSVFKLQNQGGKPGIFWQKESIPKNDRKFGYKKKAQRFNLRKYPGDAEYEETGLSPDEEPAPPPKPAKNFIKRNKEKLAVKGKPEGQSAITLTQEQLNAILRSVGKVAGGHKNAIKISIDKKTDKNSEITVESPRRKKDADYRYDDDDNEEYEDRREKRRNKKKREPIDDESAGGSIYDLLNSQAKPKNTSDNESVNSEGSVRVERRRKPHKERKDRQSRRKHYDNDDDYEEELEIKTQKSRSRKTYNHDDDDDDDRGTRKRRTKSKNARKYLSDDEEEELIVTRGRRNRSKPRHYDDADLDDEEGEKENRRKNGRRSKKRDDSYDDDIDNKEYDHRERTKRRDKSRRDDHSTEKRDRSEKRDKGDKGRQVSNEHESNLPSVKKTEDEEVASPRDKIGLPNDLSWRHMSKAERKRLEMARQKFLDEEEKREEDRIRQLQYKYGGGSSDPVTTSPSKRIATRSDPSTRNDRVDRGRETDLSTRTEDYRRGRRSLSPSEARSPDRSPEVPSVDTSPKAMPVPQRHLSLAERKRLEWERERVESKVREQQETWDPWGRPGAGAPLRSRSGHVAAEYRGRQDQMRSSVIEEEEVDHGAVSDPQPRPPRDKKKTPRHYSPQPHPPSQAKPETDALPHAMRSSFVLGQAAPDFDKFNDTKERERKQWLADLQKQIEEKKAKDMKMAEDGHVADTWADKFGQTDRPSQFVEQPQGVPGLEGYVSNQSAPVQVDTYRTSSAPTDGAVDESATHIRGQNAPIDPITKKELEDKRRVYLEHQMAIKAQVEEKERLKKMERERKRQEDQEEERKLQAERDALKQQFENEQQKQRQKEAQKQAQVNQLKAAMDEAQASALQEKYQRKMKHLEAGGHDTTKLREHLEGELTSRIEQLHTRRERDVQKAQQLLDLQYWGLNKIDEEGQGEMETAKITPRSDPPNSGVIVNAPTHVPGLDLHTTRTNHPQHMDTTKREPDHDPYVEDRVLTPSRFRHPSKPWSDPSSPRREFGTQTGNRNMSDSERDVDNIKNLLNTSLPREESEVQIEYRLDKKVRVVSAPKEMVKKRQARPKEQSPHREQPSPHQHHHEVQKRRELIEEERKKRMEQLRRKGPVKPGSRPKWGYKNMENRQAPKNSEKDPFFETKKRESQMRRYQREQQLLAMVEANKKVIPKHHVPAHKSRDPSPYSDYEHDSVRETRVNRRSQSHSPHRTLSHDRYDYLPVHDITKPVKSDTRRKSSRSPQRDRAESPPARQSRPRQRSPPVPAIKHRNEGGEEHKKGGKYGDGVSVDHSIQNGKFVPFTRTVDVLDPLKADEPLPLSREATLVANARRQYFESLHPERFGNKQAVYQDSERNPLESKDPLMNPAAVLDYPTSRQDQILVQLSTLKQSLMQRQRELETFSPSDLERQDIAVL